ncbi:hypothetical protein EHF33_19960 (plasmid) [Deinococcus psychrotolerans]|uniref:Uncharacterized protein n=1 Tax=Deinococcus psychrotolerans TaxID=2489213 RepID=A0A3G8YKI2_9DEIO|nr:hypothetical protein [Deinococcus psychrotolerans]AZI45190.1 hypothetical protein EHF33_19960 [Deinococcus psychrotolerans]
MTKRDRPTRTSTARPAPDRRDSVRDGSVQRMSLTHALKELKLLEHKIGTRLGEVQAVRVRPPTQSQPGGLSEAAFAERARSAFTSLRALSVRRSQIKAALVQANATTSVEIAGETMTLAAAVERKRAETLGKSSDQQLLNLLGEQYGQAVREQTSLRFKLEGQLQVQLQSLLGNDAGRSENAGLDADSLTTLFWSRHEPVIDDPLDLATQLLELRDQAAEFASSVDRIIDERNATTFIEVPASV